MAQQGQSGPSQRNASANSNKPLNSNNQAPLSMTLVANQQNLMNGGSSSKSQFNNSVNLTNNMPSRLNMTQQ
jgi:hypothetical protein